MKRESKTTVKERENEVKWVYEYDILHMLEKHKQISAQ